MDKETKKKLLKKIHRKALNNELLSIADIKMYENMLLESGIELDTTTNREWFGDKIKTKENALKYICWIGLDYDGCRNQEDLKDIIDELVEIAYKGRNLDK